MIKRIVALLSLLLLFENNALAQNLSGGYTILPDAGAIAHTLAPRFADAITATDFCTTAQATGSTDATVCLQSAVNALCARSSNGGGMLYIPAGTYIVSGTINVTCSGIYIQGAGYGDRDVPSGRGTMLVADSSQHPTYPVIVAQASSPTGFGQGFTVKGLIIYNSNGSRTGSFIDSEGFSNVTIEQVAFFAPCNAIRINGGLNVYVSNTRSDSSIAGCDSVVLTGNVTQANRRLDVVAFDRVALSTGSGGNCYHITDRVQTVWWRNTTCETGGRAILATCDTMASPYDCPGFFTLYDFESESSNPGNLKMIHITDLVDGFKMTDSWLRGGGPPDYNDNLLYIDAGRFPASPALNVTVANNWLKLSGGSCVYVTAGRASFTGNHIYGCNNWGIGAYGIELVTGNATITGNTFCGADWLNDVSWPMQAGRIKPGADYTVWTGNVFMANQNGKTNGCTGGVSNGSTGTHNLIVNNVG